MSSVSKTKRKFIAPSIEEDAAIAAGIAADADTYALSGKEFAQIKRMGRPRATVTKERITIRLTREVVERFRATGDGWQTRVDEALKEWLKTHA